MPITKENARARALAANGAMTPEQRKARASKGYLSAAVNAVVARAPELSSEQVAKLRAVFAGGVR